MSDSIRVPFTWENPEVNTAENALVLRRREHEQVVQTFHKKKKNDQAQIDQLQEQLDQGKQVVLRERADNRAAVNSLRTDLLAFENKKAMIIKDREEVNRKEAELRAREEQSKRNRTLSMTYVEDNFANLSPADVVEHLTHSSPRIRDHVMKNLEFCINGSGDPSPTFVRFGAAEIAPFLLPKLDQLLSAPKPSDSVVKFSEDIVSTPVMAKALALSNQCSKLANYLVRNNEVVSRFAISALRQMLRTDAQVAQAVYVALQDVVSHVPLPDSPSGPSHPSVEYIAELCPKIVGECFNNGLWSAVSPLVMHRSEVIRRAVLPKIISEASSSDRVRHELVGVGTIRLLEHHYDSPDPPLDTIDFFIGLLPILAEIMCHDIDQVRWLISRLNDPTPRITTAVIAAFRISSSREDPAIHDVFVEAQLLRKLNETTTTQETISVISLICDLLPTLALPHARANTCSHIIGFLDHAEETVAEACLAACMKIVDSTTENRAALYSEFSNLNFTKQSTLRLCDSAMPSFCKDRVAAGDYAMISKYLFHQERRVRVAVQGVWSEAVLGSPSALAKIVRDGHLGVVFDLCNSQYEDCVILGCKSLPFMAVDVAKAGPSSTRHLVNLLDHPRLDLRQAVLEGTHIIAESGDANCEVLLQAGTFNSLKLALQRYPLDSVQTTHKILVRLAPFISKSYDACCGLLQLLESTVPEVESAIRAALNRISHTTIEYRETLRSAIIARLQLASDTLVEFSVQAIQEWIGPDLVQLNNFEQLFRLATHRDRRVQNVALYTLKQKMHNREYQDSLEKAEVVILIRSLSKVDNPEAINFVAFALRSLALALARHGHVGEILHHLAHEEPSIQEGASAGIEAIAGGSEHERGHLLDEDILERLTGSHERLGPTELRLTSAIIPRLAFDYVHLKKVKLILTLVDYRQEPIRMAATKAVIAIAGGTDAERRILRDTMLPLLGSASAALLEVASRCLKLALARDLLSDGEYKQVFGLLESEDPTIREPVVSALQHFIQASGVPARNGLVEAGILNTILHASTKERDNLVLFTADCVLPVLGPSFTQNDGGASVIPLLKHEEPRIRAAAATAIRNGVESRHGNLQNIANARIISHLHSTMEDDTVRDLWCYVLPKIAPFQSNRYEIDVLFDSLSDPRPLVRRAASDAISVMAKTSDETRLRLFPALIPHLDGPPDAAVEQIAIAVSLSGSVFISSGNEDTLLHLIEHGEPALAVAAIDAVIQLLSKGTPYEHEKLIEAELFFIALRLHETGSQRHLSLKLLDAIIKHLTHVIVLDEDLAEHLLRLFDDPDIALSQSLYESLTKLADDPRIGGSTLLQLLPALLDTDRQRKPFVSRVLCHLASYIVPRLFKFRKANIIVQLLMAEEDTVTRAYIQEVSTNLVEAPETEKDLLASEPYFVPALGNFLKSQDVTLRRISSTIIEILSESSILRSVRLMEEGIGRSLAWIATNGGNDVQASLDALRTLYLTAPDHAGQLLEDSLPALCVVLESDLHEVEVYTTALRFLYDIARRAPNRAILGSGVVRTLVMWLHPRHSVVDHKCGQYIFDICHTIAQKTNSGRKAMIEERILPVLLLLTTDKSVDNVVNACNILKALAHSGTYRSEMISAGVKDAMEKITSPFAKSSLEKKTDKKLAKDAAKEVIVMLKSTSQVTPPSSGSPARTVSPVPPPSLSSRNSTLFSNMTRSPVMSQSTLSIADSGFGTSELGEVARPRPSRTPSETTYYSERGTLDRRVSGFSTFSRGTTDSGRLSPDSIMPPSYRTTRGGSVSGLSRSGTMSTFNYSPRLPDREGGSGADMDDW